MTRPSIYTCPLTLRLTPEDHEALALLARAEGTTIMAVVRRAIKREIERAEWGEPGDAVRLVKRELR